MYTTFKKKIAKALLPLVGCDAKTGSYVARDLMLL